MLFICFNGSIKNPILGISELLFFFSRALIGLGHSYDFQTLVYDSLILVYDFVMIILGLFFASDTS